jgi:hypothetical protein
MPDMLSSYGCLPAETRSIVEEVSR